MDIIPFITISSDVNKVIEIEKTIDVLLKWSRFPVGIVGSKEQAIMLKQIEQKVDDFKAFFIGSKGFKTGDIDTQQFNISLPTTFTELYELLDKYRKLALTGIGIYNVDEKRERIVTSEINSQNDYVDFIYTERVEERKRFIQEVNDKWGFNIELEETWTINKKDEQQLTLEEISAEQKIETEGEIEVEKVKNEGGSNNE